MPARHKIIPDTEHIRFGAYMRSVRESVGISQRVLAKLLNLPQSYVSKIESGQRQLQALEFIELCRLLKVNPATVLSGFVEQTQCEKM